MPPSSSPSSEQEQEQKEIYQLDMLEEQVFVRGHFLYDVSGHAYEQADKLCRS